MSEKRRGQDRKEGEKEEGKKRTDALAINKTNRKEKGTDESIVVKS